MADILDLDKAIPSAGRIARKSSNTSSVAAEIIIFPGVRYERLQKKPTRRRKSRAGKTLSSNSKPN